MFRFIYSALEELLEDSILYDAPVKQSIDCNLITVVYNGVRFNFDFKNGKLEQMWINGTKIPLSLSEKYKLTILIMS